MAVYATYTQYTTDYHGSAIAEADFPHWALLASAEIDRQTFGRAAPIVTAGTDTDTIALITLATCALADELVALGESGGAIQFEMVGRHSISYASPLTAGQRIGGAVRRYLENTGLLYRGLDAD